jgi:hypothetical protein
MLLEPGTWDRKQFAVESRYQAMASGDCNRLRRPSVSDGVLWNIYKTERIILLVIKSFKILVYPKPGQSKEMTNKFVRCTSVFLFLENDLEDTRLEYH